jgi:uncharacterized tellurite resistance protein B-like protein
MANTTEEKNIKKSHLLLLLQLARADDRMHVNEDKFMRLVAKRIGLNNTEFEEVKFYPERFTFTLHKSQEGRFKCFVDLLNLMKVDYDIAKEEIDFIKRIGLILGINIPLTEDLVALMEKFIGKEVPYDVIEEAAQKYLN